MNFVENISNITAKWLASKVPNTKYPSVEDQIEVYTYGWMVIWGAILKGIIMVSLTSLLGVFTPAMIIMITFSSMRIIAGGFHFNEYNKCITVSTIQFALLALITQHTYQYWSNTNLWYLLGITSLITLYIIIRFVPGDTPNKPITDPIQRRKFKRWSFIYLIIWSILNTIFLQYNFNLFVISSCFGLLLELFSISNVGYQAYSKLSSINSSN